MAGKDKEIIKLQRKVKRLQKQVADLKSENKNIEDEAEDYKNTFHPNYVHGRSE